ncbi:MAG TPA: ABC transporter permease [Actinomycetota bacterium]|nr:ABC transporter permease [Actinomycetota bacterium]
MSLRRSLAIIRHEYVVMFTDPSTLIFILIIPLVMVAMMQQLFDQQLAAEGFPGANGSEFAIPGMAVGFGAFGVSYAGFTFFRDHGWGTWDRLRAAPISSVELITGKVVPTVSVTVLQLAILFLLGGPLFDFSVKGSVVAIALIIVVLAVSLSAFGMAVTAVSRTMQQLNAIGSVGAFGMAMLGGTWVPVDAMPGWAQAVAPAMPTYWAMKGFRSVILEAGGVGDVVVPLLVLIGFGIVFTILAAARFRLEESKAYYG